MFTKQNFHTSDASVIPTALPTYFAPNFGQLKSNRAPTLPDFSTGSINCTTQQAPQSSSTTIWTQPLQMYKIHRSSFMTLIHYTHQLVVMVVCQSSACPATRWDGSLRWSHETGFWPVPTFT